MICEALPTPAVPKFRGLPLADFKMSRSEFAGLSLFTASTSELEAGRAIATKLSAENCFDLFKVMLIAKAVVVSNNV